MAWLLEPAHPDEFVQAWRAALERGLRPRVLGGGANVIIEDGEHAGVVITTERMNRIFRPVPHIDPGGLWKGDAGMQEPTISGATPFDDAPLPLLVAWAGAGLPGLVRTARELGWEGLEGLVGVPGQVGGGVAMNAGGRRGEMWDVVQSVRLLTPEGELVDRARAACAPRYRDANLGGAIVLGAVLRLGLGRRAQIRERMRDFLAEKSAAQPVSERSCGCIFKNPDPELSDGRGAGQLVDDCGALGRARGDALVSPKHGNFIVNRGRASSADVLGLIGELRTLVQDRTGVELRLEAKLWPR